MTTLEQEVTDDGYRTYNDRSRDRIRKEIQYPPKRPDDKQYNIWSEGYIAQGNSADAHFHGISYGKTFKEALDRFAEVNPEFAQYYDKKTRSYWGCRLYDTESAARKVYG